MVEFIGAILILIGFLTVVAACGLGLVLWLGQAEEPATDPYRDGLDAAARISAMAFEAEQLMHQAARSAKCEDEEESA